MPRVLCTTQLTTEWFDARCGKVTGSNVSLVMKRMKVNRGDKKKGDSSAERDRYKDIIISEMLSGKPVKNYVSPWMDEGRENEPLARAVYEHRMDCEVYQTGFVLHPSMDRFGASPDGILPEGCVEFKCPAQNNHIAYARREIIPPEYIDQMQSEIVCAEAEWCDFVSYCPDMKAPFDMYRVRVYRDDKRIAEIEDAVKKFLEEIAGDIQRTAERLGTTQLPSKHAPESKLNRQLRESMEALDVLDDDWEQIIERRAHAQA